MGEKINWIKEDKDGLLRYLILECVSSNKVILERLDFTASNLDVQFIINGIDMPIKSTFEKIEDQLNELIERKAKKLIKERLNEFNHSLDQLVEHIETVVYNKFDEGDE